MNPKIKIKYWGFYILVVVVVFAFIYWGISSDIKNVDDFGSALYFSIVTITTLGFGDMYPEDTLARMMVCLEAMAGVVFVGIFLNLISEVQAQRLNEQEKKRNKYERYLDAKAKLRQHYLQLNKLFEKYLQAAYYVVTPNVKRKMPDDVFNYRFDFTFNDMADLYEPPQILTHQFNTSAVVIFLDVHERLYQELRHTADTVDLSFWPSLESDIHSFMQQCSDFFYKESIVNNGLLVPQNNPELSMRWIVSKMIHDHIGDFTMDANDLKTPYASLYNMLKINIDLVQQIAHKMAEESITVSVVNDVKTEGLIQS